MAIEDIKLPPNDEAHTIHVLQPDYDAQESAEVLHLETIGCSSSDVDVHALFVPVFVFVIKTILWQEVVSPSGDFIVSSIAECHVWLEFVMSCHALSTSHTNGVVCNSRRLRSKKKMLKEKYNYFGAWRLRLHCLYLLF